MTYLKQIKAAFLKFERQCIGKNTSYHGESCATFSRKDGLVSIKVNSENVINDREFGPSRVEIVNMLGRAFTEVGVKVKLRKWKEESDIVFHTDKNNKRIPEYFDEVSLSLSLKDSPESVLLLEDVRKQILVKECGEELCGCLVRVNEKIEKRMGKDNTHALLEEACQYACAKFEGKTPQFG